MKPPPLCLPCTIALRKEVHHAPRRRCCQVQALNRYRASDKGRKANTAAQARWRERRRAQGSPASPVESPPQFGEGDGSALGHDGVPEPSQLVGASTENQSRGKFISQRTKTGFNRRREVGVVGEDGCPSGAVAGARRPLGRPT